MIRLRRFNARGYMSNSPGYDFQVKKKVGRTYEIEDKLSRKYVQWKISGDREKLQGMERA